MRLKILIVCLSVCLSACALPFIGGGIAGAGKDSYWVKQRASDYPEYRSPELVTVKLSKEALGQMSSEAPRSRSNLLLGIPEQTKVQIGQTGLLNGNEISFNKESNGLRINIKHSQISELIPDAFYMDALQVAQIHIGNDHYWLLIANSRSSTNRTWFGIFQIDGKKLFASSLEQGILRVIAKPNEFALFRLNKPAFFIQLGKLD
ncbi:MAG: hypothetical protein K2Q15_04560 [Burkholderiales bacterium]|nr:hypothetical protein [Burkholderiales bacterium]